MAELETNERYQTKQAVLNQIYGGKVPKPRMLFLVSMVLTCVGIYIAFQFFRDHAGTVSVFFTTLGLVSTVEVLIERNKQTIDSFDLRRGKFKKDAQLATSVAAIFVGMFLAYGIIAIAIPKAQLLSGFKAQLGPWLGAKSLHYAWSDLGAITLNNLGVGLGVLALSVIYRIGGALLVLGWNASVWGLVFAYLARVQQSTGLDAVIGWGATVSCVFLHILLEAVGYVAMALTGVICVRLYARMSDPSLDKKKTAINAAILGGVGIATILLAALVEVTVSPWLLNWIQPGA